MTIKTEANMGMSQDQVEMEIKNIKSDVKEIKEMQRSMPDQVAEKLNETLDMKIKLAISEVEKKYMGKFILMMMGIIGEGIGLVLSFVLK